MNPYIKFRDMKADEKVQTVVLLVSVEERETRTPGKYYCQLTLSDGEQEIGAKLWNCTKAEVAVPERSLISAEIYPKIYKEELSFEVYSYCPAPGEANLEDFIITAPYPSEEMYSMILSCLRKEIPGTSETMDLIHLVENIYAANKTKLLYWSAAKAVHHNCYGGLLYHTLRMLKTAAMMRFVYPDSYDKEVLLCAVALHDIGKLQELETDSLGVSDYSVDGSLFGHTLLGISVIDQEVAAAKEVAKFQPETDTYDPEKVRMLKHAIAAHHGNLEWGAITLPATPEAMLLHEIDMIDSRMYQYENHYKTIEAGKMTDRIYSLNGTRVYKPNYLDKEGL